MALIRVGTAGWTDPTLVRCHRFYPKSAKTAEARLRHYASVFPLVEVDATYYALPSVENAHAWAERTPPDFVFDVKAFSLLTGHPTRPVVLPRDLQAELTDEQLAKRNVYATDLSAPLVDEVFRRFRDGVAPLAEAKKLGSILLQFPPWLAASRPNAGFIQRVARQLDGLPVTVELRNATWLDDAHRDRTLSFLRTLKLPLVCVDMPQGFASSLPPLAVATAKRLSVVRFHGRNRATWETKTKSAAERFDYLYTKDELSEWVDRIAELSEEADEVHVIMNNCHEDKAVHNARDIGELLRDQGLPVAAPTAPTAPASPPS